MERQAPIVVLNESEASPDISGNHMDITELKLDILDTPLDIYIGAKDKMAKLSDLVPLARQLSEEILSITDKKTTESGEAIACRKKCSHCCRYLVPLTIPEAMRLTEEVESRPLWERRFVVESCLLMARCILELTPKSSLEKFINIPLNAGTRFKDLSDWYSRIDLPCPFLVNHLCTIYEQRPIACREHMVTGSNSNCEVRSVQPPHRVQMPVSILESLARLTNELEKPADEVIILPFVLIWRFDRLDCFKHAWPASELVSRFVDILTNVNKNTDQSRPLMQIRTLPSGSTGRTRRKNLNYPVEVVNG
jgi:Fe-S-cluster containining protein